MLVLSETSEAWWQLLSEGSSHYSNGNIKAGRATRGPQITLFTGNNSNPFIIQHGPRVTTSATSITLYCAELIIQLEFDINLISFDGYTSTVKWRWKEAEGLSPRQSLEMLQHYACHLSFNPALLWQCWDSWNIFWGFCCPTSIALYLVLVSVHVNRDCMLDSGICVL